jgi:glycosyltransferase involved in cell wall biosynthesis
LNSAYKFIDALVIRFSDSIWGLSDTLSGIRKSQGVPKRKIVLAATGVDTGLIKPLPYLPEKRFKLLFVGLINPMNGIELAIDAMPKLLTLDARITLDVVGEGEDLPKMKEKVKKYGLQNKVHFFKVMSIEELSKKLPQCGIGLATYQPLDDSTLKTTDPMKTKLYMAAGLPIISTDVYKSAHEINDEKLGKIIAYNVVELVKAVGEVLNEKTYQNYRANCLRFVRKYDWEHVFDTAISHTKFL